jgi:hypothetical protein
VTGTPTAPDRPATRSLTGRLARLPRPAAYPILLALLLPVSMFNGLADQIDVASAIRPLLVAALVGLVVAIAFTALFRGDKDRGAVLAATVIMVIGWGRMPQLALLPLIVLVFLGLDQLNRRRGRPALPWHLVTTLMTLGVTIALGANLIATFQTIAPWQPQPPIATGLAAGAPGTLEDPSLDPTTLPDIYLVLLDGHARFDTLDELGMDTSALRTDFADAGLTIAADAHTSYGFTALVLASMFNGDHLDDLEADGVIDRTATGGIDTWSAIQRGRMLERFRQAGYQIVTVSSGFNHVDLRSADRFIDPGQMSFFEYKLLDRGLSGALIDGLGLDLPYDQMRSRIRTELALTADLASEPSAAPRLVLTHVPAPHTPLVFHADGSPRDGEGMLGYENEAPFMVRVGKEAWAEAYAGEVQYVDSLALDTVREIRAQDPNAVIVLFSDHGHQWIRFPYGSPDDQPYAEYGDMTQRSRVLLAASTPGRDGVIEDDTMLVNLLGRLLHAYAGQPWTDQPDERFDCTTDASQCTPWTEMDDLARLTGS